MRFILSVGTYNDWRPISPVNCKNITIIQNYNKILYTNNLYYFYFLLVPKGYVLIFFKNVFFIKLLVLGRAREAGTSSGTSRLIKYSNGLATYFF